MFVNQLTDFLILKNQLNDRWTYVMENTSAFRYKLNIRHQKMLEGVFGFVVQLNCERSTMRRRPQVITSIQQPFNENEFNFNQVGSCETLIDYIDLIENENGIPKKNYVKCLINNSPLTRYHSLVCPNIGECLPQILTMESIQFVTNMMFGFADRKYIIGYNSLGAMASVNHLHFHLIWIEEKLFIQNAKTVNLFGEIFTLDETYPFFALCLPISKQSDINTFTANLYIVVQHLITMSKPHNLIWTYCQNENLELVKVFIFPRNYFSDKHQSGFNVAFCELGGFVPVGDENEFMKLTENAVIDNINRELGSLDSQRLISEIREKLLG